MNIVATVAVVHAVRHVLVCAPRHEQIGQDGVQHKDPNVQISEEQPAAAAVDSKGRSDCLTEQRAPFALSIPWNGAAATAAVSQPVRLTTMPKTPYCQQNCTEHSETATSNNKLQMVSLGHLFSKQYAIAGFPFHAMHRRLSIVPVSVLVRPTAVRPLRAVPAPRHISIYRRRMALYESWEHMLIRGTE